MIAESCHLPRPCMRCWSPRAWQGLPSAPGNLPEPPPRPLSLLGSHHPNYLLQNRKVCHPCTHTWTPFSVLRSLGCPFRPDWGASIPADCDRAAVSCDCWGLHTPRAPARRDVLRDTPLKEWSTLCGPRRPCSVCRGSCGSEWMGDCPQPPCAPPAWITHDWVLPPESAALLTHFFRGPFIKRHLSVRVGSFRGLLHPGLR